MGTLYDDYIGRMNALQSGDLDLLSAALTDPDTITPDEQRSMADKLGLKNAFARAAVDTFSDPIVWISMLLSSRFPTRAWLQGVVPDRFVGAANEFTGLSALARPVVDFFRGTPIPKMVALKMRREAEVMRAAKPLTDIMERATWAEEMPIVSMLLEGQNPGGASSTHRELAQTVRGAMDDLWGFLSQTRRVSGGFEGNAVTRARVEPWTSQGPPKYLRDYLPHMPTTWINGTESTFTLSGAEALQKFAQNTRGVASMKGVPADGVWSIQGSDRLGSDFVKYQTFLNNVGANVFNPHLFKRSRVDVKLQSALGQELFVADLNQVFQKYTHSVARSYALNAPLSPWERTLTSIQHEDGSWTRPTDEPVLVQLINNGLDSMRPKLQRAQIPGTNIIEERIAPHSVNPMMKTALESLVRSVRGMASHDEILFGNMFGAIRQKLTNTIGRTMGNRELAKIDDALTSFERNQGYREVSNGIASWFYTSTMGLNPWSALQNLLQPIITTAPAIGIGPTLSGIREMGSKMPGYFREVRRQWQALGGTRAGGIHRLNEAMERGFATSFPELARHGFRVDPRLMEIDEATLARGAFRTADDYAKLLLQPFTHTELSNQASTFYAARGRLKTALKTGEWEFPFVPEGVSERPMNPGELDDYLNFHASQSSAALQFRPGPGSRSLFQEMLPPPLRQFTSFPTRMLSFFADSTVRGAMTKKQIDQAGAFAQITGGRNLGTLSRWYIYSKMATEGAREALGIDLSRSLMVPFNLSPLGQPFAPIPVPPIVDVTAGLLSAATTGDTKELDPLTLPGIGEIPFPKTLFPGGLAISRATRAWQQFRPDMGGFVDDQERLMYRAGTSDLVLAMLGIPLEKGRRTRNAIERLEAVKGRMRQYRRDYAVAHNNFDTDRMTLLETGWRQAFPEFPPLTVDSIDIDRYRANARMTAVQRSIRGLGRGAGYLEQSIYEVEPELIVPDSMQTPSGIYAGIGG